MQPNDSSFCADKAVYIAAASEPLIEKDSQFVFDKDSFLKRVLLLAQEEGQA